MSELLAGLGVIDRAGPATFSLVGRDGKARDVSIEPITVEEDLAWHSGQPLGLPATDAPWLRDQAKALWWSYLADSRTLFVQYNAVEAGINAIADEILARAKEDDVARVVVDLRHNVGGDNTTMRHFEDVLRDPAINRPGRLVVLIGRLTFSAAANFATDLEQSSARNVRGRGDGRQPEPLRRRQPDRPAVRRPIGLRRDALLAAKHGRRPADHDRPGDPGRALVRRLFRRSRPGSPGGLGHAGGARLSQRGAGILAGCRSRTSDRTC